MLSIHKLLDIFLGTSRRLFTKMHREYDRLDLLALGIDKSLRKHQIISAESGQRSKAVAAINRLKIHPKAVLYLPFASKGVPTRQLVCNFVRKSILPCGGVWMLKKVLHSRHFRMVSLENSV